MNDKTYEWISDKDDLSLVTDYDSFKNDFIYLMYDYEKNFNKGDKLILAAYGAGLTWGAAYLKWAYN